MINIPVTFQWDNCVCGLFSGKHGHNKESRQHIAKAYSQQGYNVSILPTDHHAYSIKSLSDTNHVESWITTCVSTDKTYIFANFNALPMDVVTADSSITDAKELSDKLLNNKADNILHPDLERFLDPLWDETLKGNPLQMFIVIKQLSFLVNSYPLVNANGLVNGAVMFMRFYNPSPQDLSHELHRILREPPAASSLAIEFIPHHDKHTGKPIRRSSDA